MSKDWTQEKAFEVLEGEITRLRNELHIAQEWSSRVIAGHEQDITEITALRSENERLKAALGLYREAVRIDATMEGPKFMGSNASALKRAWDADRAALTQPAEKGWE